MLDIYILGHLYELKFLQVGDNVYYLVTSLTEDLGISRLGLPGATRLRHDAFPARETTNRRLCVPHVL